MVNVTAQKCTITPINPPELIGGVLKDVTPNVTIDCSCNDDNDTAIMELRWFFPDDSQVTIVTESTPGSPYFVASSDTASTLIIPVFNDTYKGNYTCKPKGELKNDSPMSTIQLLLGE